MEATATPARGPRRDAVRNRELLLAAARDVFGERGVDASLEEIARRAGVGIGTLYRHFPSRQALIDALLEERLGAVVTLADAAAAEPGDGLEDFLQAMIDLQARERVLRDVLHRSAHTGRVAELRAEVHAALDALLAGAHAQGVLRTDFTLSDLALLLWSFGPLIDAGIPAAARRRHLHWALDGLRPAAATAQSAPPLSQAQLERAAGRLRGDARRAAPGSKAAS